jgi:hypothetical protein
VSTVPSGSNTRSLNQAARSKSVHQDRMHHKSSYHQERISRNTPPTTCCNLHTTFEADGFYSRVPSIRVFVCACVRACMCGGVS